MLWHFPKRLGTDGRKADAVINTEDLMPTLLGLAGVSLPDSVEGLDFSAYLAGGPDPGDGAALLTCPMPFGQWARRWGGREYRGLRTTRHTYARDLRGPWLLFDNEKDPFQLDKLIGSPEHEALAARLDALLKQKLEQTGDQFLPGMAYIQRWDARWTQPAPCRTSPDSSSRFGTVPKQTPYDTLGATSSAPTHLRRVPGRYNPCRGC